MVKEEQLMIEKDKVSRRKALEQLFREFPDVPREVIVKEDVLRYGLDFTEAALQVGEGFRTKRCAGLFTYDHIRPEEAVHIIRAVPFHIEIHKGLYGLRNRLMIGVHVHTGSPYIVDKQGEELWLCEREKGSLAPIAPLYPYLPIPKYWSMYFEDGTPYREIVRDTGNANVTLFTQCQYWGAKEECKYCDINANARAAKERGDLHISTPYLKVEYVVKVLEQLFLHEAPERPPYDRPRYIFLTGGAILKKLDGLDEDGFYLRYVRAIKELLGNRWILVLQTSPKTKEKAKEYVQAGVDCHNSNLEVWDKRLFSIICPGKSRAFGWENWVRLMLEEVNVFGEGNVAPGFVQGCETAKPWGLSVDEAVKSYEDCYEFLMSHGVVPRPISWYLEPLSGLGGQEPPPTEYFIRIDRAWYEKWTKYRLPPQRSLIMGPGRSEFPNGAFADMGEV